MIDLTTYHQLACIRTDRAVLPMLVSTRSSPERPKSPLWMLLEKDQAWLPHFGIKLSGFRLLRYGNQSSTP